MNILILDLGSNSVKTEALNSIGTIGGTKLEILPNGLAKLSLELTIDGKELIKILPAKKEEKNGHEAPKRAIKI